MKSPRSSCLAAMMSLLAIFTFAGSSFAAAVTPEQACAVAAAWAAENAALAQELGAALAPVAEADADGTILWYEVPTSAGGCLVVAPDTQLEPVIAVVPDYAGGIPAGHPLRALLENDMRQRLAVLNGTASVRARSAESRSAAAGGTPAEVAADASRAAKKWARLTGEAGLASAGGAGAEVAAATTAAATPARVYSFFDGWKRDKLTHWNQNGWNSFGRWDNVYDLYVPNHYPCGCVATAGAALLQFFGVTQAPSLANTCTVDGVKTNLTTKGGTYDWSILPTRWYSGQTLTDEQKDLLGRVTYDMGVCLGMSYKSTGSGASCATLATVLREQYGFADARYVQSISASHYEKLIYAQVRSGYPVVLSIWNASSGHAVLAVGYGEDADAAAYTRVFMGWGGSYDAWYALPNIDEFTAVDGVVTMIGTSSATVPVCGRIVDETGIGDGFAIVSRYTSSASSTSLMANEHGAWGTRVSPTLAAAAQKVSCKGVTQTYSIGTAAATVQTYNSADTLCAALPDVLTLTLPSEKILPVQMSIAAARERAILEGKPVFLLGGTAWCGYCAMLKRYLNSLGKDFTDRFVLCYLDMDEEQPSAMRVGGYPTYGIFDPRRMGEKGWTAANGLLVQDGGWDQSRVDALLAEGWAAWSAIDRSPTELVLALPAAIVSATPCAASVAFADGESYPLADGVAWSLVSGTAARIADGVVTPVEGETGTVTVRAEATVAGETLVRTAEIRVVAPSDVVGLVVAGPEVIDLYDVAGAQFTALATLADGTAAGIAVDWSVLESGVTNAVVSSDGLVTFPNPEKYTVAARLTVSAGCNGVRASKEVDVWGWSATVAAWTMPQQTLWPGETIRVLPQSVIWWRHGVTEEPTSDFTGVSFSFYAYIRGSEWHYLRGGETDSPDGVSIAIPADFESGDGYGYMNVCTRATRRDRTVSTWGTKYFAYLAAAPAETVAVTFVANGGEPATQTSTYAVGVPYGYLPQPYRKGYSLQGWYTAETGGTRVTGETNCLASVTRLFAQWSPKYYRISYDANGGLGYMDGKYFYYDQPDTLRANAFTKVGHAFVGWAAEPDGEVVFDDGATILNLFSTYTNIVLYAAWTPGTYAVTLDRQSGTGGSTSATATYGSAMPAITVPTRTGYEFGGYYTAANGGGTQYYSADGTPARDCDLIAATTLYAKWTPTTYSVTLDRQSGTGGSASATATYGSAMPAITVPTRTGYAFGGYFTAANGGGTQYYTASGASAKAWDKAAATTLYAKWSPNSYRISYDANGGTGTMGFSQFYYDTPATLRANLFMRRGYVFAGWATEPDGEVVFADGEEILNLYDAYHELTLYAHWTEDAAPVSLPEALDSSLDFTTGGDNSWFGQHSVTCDGIDAAQSGAIADSQSSWMQTVVSGPGSIRFWWKVSSESASCDYLEFLVDGTQVAKIGGTNMVSWAQVAIAVAGSGTHTLQWNYGKDSSYCSGFDCGWVDQVTWTAAPVRRTVTFNANGGTCGTKSRTVTSGAAVGTLPAATRKNYVFLGWYTAKTGGSKIAKTTRITANKTFYARWTTAKKAVTFNANGGTCAVKTRTVKYNAAVGTLPAATRKNYVFLGWYTAKTGGSKIAKTTRITANKAFYARWTTAKKTVTFNANGGTCGTKSRAVQYNAAIGTLPVPTREGHAFLGWYTAASGGSKVAAALKITADRTLYAHWQENETPAIVAVDGNALPTSWLQARGRLRTAKTAAGVASAWEEKAANGKTLRECYVAGLDPDDPAAQLQVAVDFVDGLPRVTYDPDLGSERAYTLEGKAALTDEEWVSPTNATHRFFRVKVALPQ